MGNNNITLTSCSGTSQSHSGTMILKNVFSIAVFKIQNVGSKNFGLVLLPQVGP